MAGGRARASTKSSEALHRQLPITNPCSRAMWLGDQILAGPSLAAKPGPFSLEIPMVGPRIENKVKPLEKPKRKATGKPFEPSRNCNGGRPKGSKNKSQSRSEGEAYARRRTPLAAWRDWLVTLKKQALLENPSPFMTGLSKLLPMMLEGNPGRAAAHRRARLLHSGRGLKPMCLKPA